MEDRSKRAETVRPQLYDHCKGHFVCDSAKSDGNDIKLNGETDDEDMEDGETGFDDGKAQVRNIRDAGQPTASEHKEHMTTHQPYQHGSSFV